MYLCRVDFKHKGVNSMFSSYMNRKPLAFKLMAVLVLCVLLAPLGHALDAQHTGTADLTEQCEICDWLLTAAFVAASVFSFCVLCPRQRIAFVRSPISSVSTRLRPSGRSPPSC